MLLKSLYIRSPTSSTKLNLYIRNWFEVIENVVKDPAILSENVYNMDETGVMFCMLVSVKVLVRTIRGATEALASSERW